MGFSKNTMKLRVWKTKEYFMRHKIFCVMISFSLFVCLRCIVRKFTAKSDSEMIPDSWVKSPYIGCDVNFIGYGNKFAVLHYAHVDVKTRTFSIPCVGYKPYYRFTESSDRNVLNAWMRNVTLYEYSYSETIATITIAIFRVEAHNLYRSMCEWYNLFLVCSLLYLDPKQVTILFMDDRPPSLLEDLWYILFGQISRYPYIPMENVYKTLIWGVHGYESPMNNQQLNSLPYLQEFREYVLNSYNFPHSKQLNCKSLNVTIIYRRDFISHPERTNGLVHRKFHNNSELFSTVSEIFEGHTITGMFLEYHSMKEQLKFITNTDILIGMHGAGLSHILFLPQHAGCFEMFPNYVQYNDRYKSLAKWRGIKYTRWKNIDQRNEFPHYETQIPRDVLRKYLSALKRELC